MFNAWGPGRGDWANRENITTVHKMYNNAEDSKTIVLEQSSAERGVFQ